MIEENDWRLLNDVDFLRKKYINPTDSEEICKKAPHLKNCIFCLDSLKDKYYLNWYIPADISCCICKYCYNDFKEMFEWKLLDGYDIEWTS